MKTCAVIGWNSDIFKGIRPMLEADGWECLDAEYFTAPDRWQLLIITMGKVAPVGYWWDMDSEDFERCVRSNLILPFARLKWIWDRRSVNASVIWFSGSNPQKIMDGYAPYNAAKMAVNKLVEQLDHETPDTKFVAFGPGYVRDSKIHRATLEKKWPNERIARGDAGNSMEQIYSALKWVIEQPKALVGGRNVCVSDVPFDNPSESRFKLRRV